VGDRDGHEASRVQSAITGQFACTNQTAP
jgi:hypothetical protein